MFLFAIFCEEDYFMRFNLKSLFRWPSIMDTLKKLSSFEKKRVNSSKKAVCKNSSVALLIFE